MKIDILFSNNELKGSKLIQWGSSFLVDNLKEIPSHVAVLINGELVIEAIMLQGVRIVPYNKWLEHNNEISKIQLELIKDKMNSSSENFHELIDEMWGKKYDFKGLFFFGIAVLKFCILKIPLPATNRWEQEDKFFCSEFVGRLIGYNYSMTSPAQMLSDILKVTNG